MAKKFSHKEISNITMRQSGKRQRKPSLKGQLHEEYQASKRTKKTRVANSPSNDVVNHIDTVTSLSVQSEQNATFGIHNSPNDVQHATSYNSDGDETQLSEIGEIDDEMQYESIDGSENNEIPVSPIDEGNELQNYSNDDISSDNLSSPNINNNLSDILNPISSYQLPVSSPDDHTTNTNIPYIPDVYINQLVAFCQPKEHWFNSRIYNDVGTAYIIGKVCSYLKKTKLFLVRWLDSQFHNFEIQINLANIKRGCKRYRSFMTMGNIPAWSALCELDKSEINDLHDELENLEEIIEVYKPNYNLSANLDEVESIKNMCFTPNTTIDKPTDLYQHADNTTKTKIKPEYAHIFRHSASASFLAYLPLYFWREVLHQTNLSYLANGNGNGNNPFQLPELMRFFGILMYMTITDKGEYSNYWGAQAEDKIFDSASIDMEKYMPLNRFKAIRKHLCFKYATHGNTNRRDPAERIRPLLNLLKVTGSRYVDIGRDVAVDEASISCRSRYGRNLIVYNPHKPGGKYHFRLYMMCCSSSWIALNYKLHCESDITDRLQGVTHDAEVQELQHELQNVAKVRQHVLEVVRPIYNTKRVVNSDNFYTSVQLLEALRIKGLYGRGTVRTNSKHFPKHIIMDKKKAVRGDYTQAISTQHGMIAASWCDGSIVTIVSNSDSSNITTVNRLVGKSRQNFSSPICIKNYNQNMQGVDRLDQIRARFSLADGHSFKKWFKKLAMAIVDIARCNAFLTRKLVCPMSQERDPHRQFMIALSTELITGLWSNAPTDDALLYSNPTLSFANTSVEPTPNYVDNTSNVGLSPVKVCTAISSRQMFDDNEKENNSINGTVMKSIYLSKRRRCIICRWEGRSPTIRTSFCTLHGVSLCQDVHYTEDQPYYCSDKTLTCWEKFHKFYHPRGLYTAKGNLAMSSELYQLKVPNAKRGLAARRLIMNGN